MAGAEPWNATFTNWTDVIGTANTTFDPLLTSVFTTAPGDVIITNDYTPNPAALRFEVGGYTILAAASAGLSISGQTDFATLSGGTTILAPISGSGVLVKSGAGTLVLERTNTYSGGTVLNGGVLYLKDSDSLGSGTLTLGEGTLLRFTTDVRPANDIKVNGNVTISPGNTTSFQFLNLSGDVDLGATTRQITTVDLSRVTLTGVISGAGGLTLAGGNFSLIPTQSNTYQGLTTVATGTSVNAMNSGTNVAIPGDVLVETGGRLTATGSFSNFTDGGQPISPTATITVNGLLTLSLSPQTIGNLQGSGEINASPFSTADTLTIESGNFSGNITELAAFRTRLVKSTNGTLILSGNNSYVDGNAVNGGTLLINGTNSGNGPTTIAANATLGGSGTLRGPITIADNARLTPGSGGTGTFETGNLNLNSDSQIDFDLGTPGVVGGPGNDLLSVAGSLVLDGILNVTAGVGFGEGVYRLIDYTGALTDGGLLLGTVPALFDYTVDTQTANQLNLLVVAAVAQFWDGPNTSANGMLDGGSAIWDGSTTNWTNSSATVNSLFNDMLVSTFSGTPGTATIADGFTPNPRALDFRTAGYTIASAGSGELILTGNTPFITAPGVTTVSAPIDGAGTLVKLGSGTLSLTGTGRHDGETIIKEGTLDVTGDIRHISGDLIVGDTNGDSAALVIRDGGYYFDDFGRIGNEFGSVGTTTVDGPGTLWSHSNDLLVGVAGTGNLIVQNQGAISARNLVIGAEPSGVGTAIVDGPGADVASTLLVGSRGTGALVIQNGATVSAPAGALGEFTTGNGSILVDGAGGELQFSSGLRVGQRGSGRLTVRNGSRLTTGDGMFPAFVRLGDESGSAGEIVVDGPEFDLEPRWLPRHRPGRARNADPDRWWTIP